MIILSGIGEAVPELALVARVLAAVPLFSITPLLAAPELVLTLIFVLWWLAVGALLAQGLAEGRVGRLLAVLFAVVIAAAHLETRATLETELAGATSQVGAAMEELAR